MEVESKHIRLRLVQTADAGFILGLRLDENLNQFISKVEDDLQKQKEWIEHYKTLEAEGQEYYFIIESKKGQSLGTVRLYDFDGKSYSWGSWLLKKGSPAFAAIETVLLIYEVTFFKLGCSKIRGDVRKENKKVLKFHRRFGARIVREDNLNCYFSMDRVEYESIRQRYRRFL